VRASALDGLFAREDGSSKVILPICHKVNATDISRFSPLLAGKLAISKHRGLEVDADGIMRALFNGDQIRSVQLDAADHVWELLKHLRAQMLAARSSWELRYSAY
jgi:hypothetical protein